MARLNHDQKYELCQLLAERRTHVHIVKYFSDIHNLLIYDSQITKYRHTKKWAEIIKEKRETWDLDLASEYLASKRNRLSELGVIMLATAKKRPSVAIAAIKQAQEEMEGKKVRLADADGGNITDSLAQVFAGIPQLIQLLHDRLAAPDAGQKLIEGE